MTLPIKVRKAENVTPVKKRFRKSKYENIVRSLGKLKPGKVLTVTPPKGSTARQLSIRLDYIFKSRVKQGILVLPEGHRISQFTTEDGDLGIALVEA